MMIVWIIIFVISLAVLIKASDYFVESAKKIGLYLKMPSFFIGVVIIGIGTSLPEFVASIVSVIKNSSEIVIGNVLGSNITNILLILGIAGIIRQRTKIKQDLNTIELPFLLTTAILFGFMIWDKKFHLAEALICLAAFVFYLLNNFKQKSSLNSEINGTESKHKPPDWLTWGQVVLSPVFIFLGANYTIESMIKIAHIMKIGPEIIALSAVSLGTSLPEVIVTIKAVKIGNPEMALGNIIGSNIFNTLLVAGTAGLITSLVIPLTIMTFALPVFVTATFIFCLVVMDKKIMRLESILLLLFYIFYLGKVFHLF